MSNVKQWFHFITVDPVNLSIKGKLLSVVACFSAIFLVAWITQRFEFNAAYPIIVASMGASAVILFIIPNSPLAQPWPLVGGQLVSAVAGMWSALVFSDTALASAVAVGGSVLAMIVLRCLHPPGAATALTPVMAGAPITSLGYGFVLVPVAVNVVIIMVLAIIINRWILGYNYPVQVQSANRKPARADRPQRAVTLTRVSEQDLDNALDALDLFVDVAKADLSKLFTVVQNQKIQRYQGYITCADIMTKNVQSVEYGTEVEDAWKMMQIKSLNALPVIDKARRVIGIITLNDFFKCITVRANATLLDTFRTFIRRTPDITTDKPEAVGHIMTSVVRVLAESTPITDLIPLLSDQGFRQIPIVNDEQRLTGMVHQAELIAALYNTLALLPDKYLHQIPPKA